MDKADIHTAIDDFNKYMRKSLFYQGKNSEVIREKMELQSKRIEYTSDMIDDLSEKLEASGL